MENSEVTPQKSCREISPRYVALLYSAIMATGIGSYALATYLTDETGSVDKPAVSDRVTDPELEAALEKQRESMAVIKKAQDELRRELGLTWSVILEYPWEVRHYEKGDTILWGHACAHGSTRKEAHLKATLDVIDDLQFKPSDVITYCRIAQRSVTQGTVLCMSIENSEILIKCP